MPPAWQPMVACGLAGVGTTRDPWRVGRLIFHIAEAGDWDAALETGGYRTSTRGRTLDEVGFIHASHRHQVERVANAAYSDVEPLVLLAIDPARLGGTELREESGGGAETFPHLYGPLPIDAVVHVEPFAPGPGGLFVPPTSWLSPKLVPGPSPIEGTGLFATSPIAVDEPVAVMGGEVMTDEEFTRHVVGLDRYSAAAIGESINIVQDLDDPLSCGNHSCQPNLWMADELTLVARHPVSPGEEVTVD